jgi:hypothetical protein
MRGDIGGQIGVGHKKRVSVVLWQTGIDTLTAAFGVDGIGIRLAYELVVGMPSKM